MSGDVQTGSRPARSTEQGQLSAIHNLAMCVNLGSIRLQQGCLVALVTADKRARGGKGGGVELWGNVQQHKHEEKYLGGGGNGGVAAA